MGEDLIFNTHWCEPKIKSLVAAQNKVEPNPKLKSLVAAHSYSDLCETIPAKLKVSVHKNLGFAKNVRKTTPMFHKTHSGEPRSHKNLGTTSPCAGSRAGECTWAPPRHWTATRGISGSQRCGAGTHYTSRALSRGLPYSVAGTADNAVWFFVRKDLCDCIAIPPRPGDVELDSPRARCKKTPCARYPSLWVLRSCRC